jgi:putative nucleotidyltransferase with HDIG domain
MTRASVLCDSIETATRIGEQLQGLFETQLVERNDIPCAEPEPYAIIDIDLSDHAHLGEIRNWLKQRPRDGKVLFAVDSGARHQAIQAYALGATDLVTRPIASDLLLTKLMGDIRALAGNDFAAGSANPGVAAAVDGLQEIFAAASFGGPLDAKSIDASGEAVVSQIEVDGLTRWIETVRKHHSQTYQHCLLVTGIAVAFAHRLGFSAADRRRLAFAGLLHDVGKARIPVAILEKAGPLDQGEKSVMKQHPVLGFKAIRAAPNLDPVMLDMVVHHHEYLDGSGYPHGLAASKLSDLVRMVTIADIFGALIERRSYKAPMPGDAAYQVLAKMGPKLDADLVREFAPVARLQAGGA